MKALRRVAALRPFETLHIRNYRLYFISQTVSFSGSMMQSVAQAWLVLKLTGSGVDLGLVTAATFLPILVGGPGAGVLVDRVDKRRLLILTQSVAGVLALTLGLLTATGAVRLWMVFVLALMLGTVNAVDSPARQVLVFDMVSPGQVNNAVGLNEVLINASRVVGPAVGGVIVATAGVSVCFFANAGSFVPAVVALLLMRREEMHSSPRKPRRRGQLIEGVGYAWATPDIRNLLFMAVASGMIFNMSVALPLVATKAFHAGAGALGLMMASFGVGAIVGALLAGSQSGGPRARQVRWLCVATGVSVMLSSVMPDLPTELVALALVGVTSISFIALANTMVQLRTVAAMRGRIMGLWTMAIIGTVPITGPIAGWVGQDIGARQALGLAGVAVLGTAALGWRSLSDHRPVVVHAGARPLLLTMDDGAVG